MNQRSTGTALQARFVGLGVAAFASVTLLAAQPARAFATEADTETEQAPIAAAANVDQDTLPTDGLLDENASEADGSADTATDDSQPSSVPEEDVTLDTPAPTNDTATDDAAAPSDIASEQSTDDDIATTPEAGFDQDTEDDITAIPAEAANEVVEPQAEGQVASAPVVATPQTLPAKAAETDTTESGSQDEENSGTTQDETEPEPVKIPKKGLHTVDGKLRYFNGKSTAYVQTGHYIKDGVLYNVKNGVAKKVNLSGRNYYRCADGTIFFSKSKGSSALATGKKGWQTSSKYGFKNKRYYFRTEGGFLYTKYGFSTAGSYGVLTGKKGYCRTSNYKKGKKLYLIAKDGRMLTLTSSQKKTYGYTTKGFRWAKEFGDRLCYDTLQVKDLYFLHQDTSDSAYTKGAYYVRYNKKGVWETDGKGLKFKNYDGDTETYSGAHWNTPYGPILRAINDNGHNVKIKHAKMPVIHKKKVYLADDDGQLSKQSTKISDWSSKTRKAYGMVKGMKSNTHYAVTVSKTTHTVYLWYSADKKNNWQPMFNCRCTTGNEQSQDSPEGTIKPTWTPPGFSRTYDHIKYFSGCCYYATGYKKSERSGWHIHSTLYSFSTGRRTDSRLAKNVSSGCIRININYARYIYKYVPLKTRFRVY